MPVRIVIDNTDHQQQEVSAAIPATARETAAHSLHAGPNEPQSAVKHSARLGQKVVNALGNPEKETWIWDTEVKGFFLRVYPSGQKTFALKYRVDGQQKVYTIGKFGSPWSVEQARERASALLYEAQTGDDPQRRKKQLRHSHTVAELVAVYLKDGPKDKPNKRKRSWDNDTLHLVRHAVPLIGAKKAHAVTAADVADLQSAVAQGKTATTVKTKKRGVARVRGGTRAAAVTLVCLQAMYNWAIKRKLVPENPCKGVTRFASEPKERYLGAGEIKALLCALIKLQETDELSAELATAFRLLLLTGARKSEITDLRWEEIDFERGFITLSALRSKTGKKRIVLSSAAMAELRTLSPQKAGYVFPAKRGEGPTRALQDAWERVRIEAGIEDVRIHDLRHTFASLAAAQGQSLYLIGRALGHTQMRTTERYAHLSQEPLRALGEGVARHLLPDNE